MSIFSVSTRFTATDNFSATLRRFGTQSGKAANSAVSGFSKVTRSVDKMNAKLNKTAGGMGTIAEIAGGLTAAAFLQTAADASLELDKNVSAAAAKFGIFDRESESFAKLEEKARKLGGTTEFTAGQAAEGLKNLATAGFDADGAIASLDTTLNLATATQSELGLAADVAGKSLAAFGLKSKDPEILGKNLERVSDVLNKIITTTGFGDLEELQTTLGMSGASAKAAGVSIEQWGAIVGTTVSAGVDASSAGSQLSMILTKLAKPTDAGAKLMEKLGIKTADAKGDFRNIFDIMRDVEKGMKGMGAVAKTSALSTLFDVRAAKMMNIVLDKGVDNVEKMEKAYIKANQENTTLKSAELMRSGLSGMVASVGSAIQELGISFSKTFDTELKAGIKNITEAARAAGQWVKRNKTLLKILLGIAAVAVKIVIAIKAYVLITKIAAAVTVGYNIALGVTALIAGKSAFAIMSNSVALKAYVVVARVARFATAAFNAVAALNPFVWIGIAIAGIVLLIIYWDEAKAKMQSFSDSAGFQLLKISNPLIALIDLIGHMQDRWVAVKTAFTEGGFLAGIAAIGKALVSFILHPLAVIFGKLAELTGVDLFKNWSTSLGGLENKLDGELGVNNATVGAATPSPEVAEALSTKVTTEKINTERTEQSSRSLLDIIVHGQADTNLTGAAVPGSLIKMPETAGSF